MEPAALIISGKSEKGTMAMEWMDGEWMLYLGLGIMAAAAAGAVIAFVVFRVTGRRLERRLTEEFGKKRH